MKGGTAARCAARPDHSRDLQRERQNPHPSQKALRMGHPKNAMRGASRGRGKPRPYERQEANPHPSQKALRMGHPKIRPRDSISPRVRAARPDHSRALQRERQNPHPSRPKFTGAQDGAPANPHPSQTALRMGHPPTVVGRYSRLHRSDRMRGKEPRAWKTNW